MTDNLCKVPQKQWRRWSDTARRVFNDTYTTMNDNPDAFLHPHAVPSEPTHWRTTAWNAAWIAADAADGR